MKFKTIQFDTLVETDLKGMITSINLTFFICVNLMESSKFDENFVKKLFFLVKSNWIRHELYILSLNLTLGISFSHINTWIVSFYLKNLFLSKFSSNFELFFRFTQITKVRFIDVIIPLRSISTNVSNCSFKFHVYRISGLQLQKMAKLLILKHGALIIDHPVFVKYAECLKNIQ